MSTISSHVTSNVSLSSFSVNPKLCFSSKLWEFFNVWIKNTSVVLVEEESLVLYIENFQKMAGIFSCTDEIVNGTSCCEIRCRWRLQGVFLAISTVCWFMFQLSGCCGQLQVWHRLEFSSLNSPFVFVRPGKSEWIQNSCVMRPHICIV